MLHDISYHEIFSRSSTIRRNAKIVQPFKRLKLRCSEHWLALPVSIYLLLHRDPHSDQILPKSIRTFVPNPCNLAVKFLLTVRLKSLISEIRGLCCIEVQLNPRKGCNSEMRTAATLNGAAVHRLY